jgi:tRNA threonylcarbamoyladenosine biosynthesis protein TsaE
MEQMAMKDLISKNPEGTMHIAAEIGRHIRGGEIIELVSDLGGGKTTFVRGLAEGMGSTELVHSPTFTVSNTYEAGNLYLYHFDFYRLDEPGVLRNELEELLADPNVVIVIEWASIVENILPTDRLTVAIRATAETTRVLQLHYPLRLQYLFAGIGQSISQ